MNPGIGRLGGVVLAAAALLGIAVVLVAAAADREQQVSMQGVVVAVVDPIQVMESLNEAKDMLAAFKDRGEEMTKKLEQAKIKEAALKADAEAAAKDDPTRRDKQLAYLRASFANKAETELLQELVNIEGADIRKKLYSKLLLAVEAIAAQNKIDLVLNDDRKLPPVGGADEQVVISIRQGRKVLYRADPIDITQQVITRMNNDHANKRN